MDNKEKSWWDRIKGIGRKKIIGAVLVVGLAAVGVPLPVEVQTAVVVAIDSVIEAI
jgi:hypothetical protein